MAFNSIGFVIFFIAILIVLLISEKIPFLSNKRNYILFIASIVFYALIDYRCLLLLVFLISYTYFFGLKVKEKKSYLTIGIVLSVVILVFFKYFNFFVDSFSKFTGLDTSLVIKVILPVGISFYVFKSISYLVDVYRGKCEAQKNYALLGLYISFFPQIVAGPISKPKHLISQFVEDKKLKLKDFTDGIQMFTIGLFKKIVIADNISVFVNEVYRAPNVYSSLTILLCVVAYSVEIYMDFSGYSDMAIGCAKILGFDVEKNFNLPYISRSITEFWKRWHITLSNWLMEYIYIPLGGNRKGKARQYLNLFLTMVIGGLWHGAGWTFIIWGAVNGIALIIDKIFISITGKKRNGIIGIIITFIFVSLTWVLFRANSLSNALDVYKQLFSFTSGISFMSTWAIFGIVVVLVATIYTCIKNKGQSFYYFFDLSTIKGLFFFFLLLGLTLGLAYTGANPFIYAAF